VVALQYLVRGIVGVTWATNGEDEPGDEPRVEQFRRHVLHDPALCSCQPHVEQGRTRGGDRLALAATEQGVYFPIVQFRDTLPHTTRPLLANPNLQHTTGFVAVEEGHLAVPTVQDLDECRFASVTAYVKFRIGVV
jgi:hypothetical protein